MDDPIDDYLQLISDTSIPSYLRKLVRFIDRANDVLQAMAEKLLTRGGGVGDPLRFLEGFLRYGWRVSAADASVFQLTTSRVTPSRNLRASTTSSCQRSRSTCVALAGTVSDVVLPI